VVVVEVVVVVVAVVVVVVVVVVAVVVVAVVVVAVVVVVVAGSVCDCVVVAAASMRFAASICSRRFAAFIWRCISASSASSLFTMIAIVVALGAWVSSASGSSSPEEGTDTMSLGVGDVDGDVTV
jgi:hypothetical protein